MEAITITQITSKELESIIENSLIRVLAKHSKPETKSNKALNIKAASEFAGCAESTIRKAFREKRLKGHRQAGRLYFFEEDLVRWIKS